MKVEIRFGYITTLAAQLRKQKATVEKCKLGQNVPTGYGVYSYTSWSWLAYREGKTSCSGPADEANFEKCRTQTT